MKHNLSLQKGSREYVGNDDIEMAFESLEELESNDDLAVVSTVCDIEVRIREGLARLVNDVFQLGFASGKIYSEAIDTPDEEEQFDHKRILGF